MITFVCWKWQATGKGGLHPKKKINFTAHHVNTLYSMLSRNLKKPFKLVCITDDPRGIDPQIETLQIWPTWQEMGGCYVRLPVFGSHMKELIGPDFFSIDLDVVIVSDITSLVEETRKSHQFKIWGDTAPFTPYNGSFFFLVTGSRRQVFERFDPIASPALGRRLKYVGTDQAWIGACLGPHEAKWSTADGVYSYRVHFLEGKRPHLQGGEKIIFFHGAHDPSKPDTQALSPWIAEHWR